MESTLQVPDSDSKPTTNGMLTFSMVTTSPGAIHQIKVDVQSVLLSTHVILTIHIHFLLYTHFLSNVTKYRTNTHKHVLYKYIFI